MNQSIITCIFITSRPFTFKMARKSKTAKAKAKAKKRELAVAARDELVATNVRARQDGKQEARRAIKNLVSRTSVHESQPCKSDWPLQQKLISFGIPPERQHFYQIHSLETAAQDLSPLDKNNLERGQLLRSEQAMVNKIPISREIVCVDRMQRRLNTTEPSAVIYKDGCGDIVAIHLQNILTESVVEERTRLKKEHGDNCLGWSKGCSLSGMLNLSQLNHDFRYNAKLRQSYFGKYQKEYQVLKIVPSKNGEGKGGKVEYLNPNKKKRAFQGGNYIYRVIVEGSVLSDNAYIQGQQQILKLLAPFIRSPSERMGNRRIGFNPRSLEKAKARDFKVAVNRLSDGSPSPPAFHQDSRVQSACAVSAEPGNGTKLASIHHANANAGQLFHEVGGLILGYSSHDVILFNGAHFHTPLSPSPLRDSGNLHVSGQKPSETASRFSYVTFLCK
jgi:hypothetical protein